MAAPPDPSELAALLANLAQAESAVQAVVQGEVDAVMAAQGDPYLLAAAQRALVTTEAQTRKQVALLEALLTSAPDYITHVGLDGMISFVNRGLSQFHREKAVGTPWLSYVPPAQQERLREIFDEVVLDGHVRDFESEGFGADGEPVWYLRRLAPLRQDDQTIGVVVLTRDVTDRHRLEQETRDARALAESIFGTLHDPFVVIDGAFRIGTVNDAFVRTFCLSGEDPIGRSFFDVTAAHRWEESELPALLTAVLEDRLHLTDHELELQAEGARPRRLLLDARRVRRDEGAVGLVVIGMRDVTDRDERIRLLERQEQLEKSNRELDAFAHSIAHDLRAPARAVGGFSKALIEDYGGLLPSEALQLVDRISLNAERMGRMVEDLLSFARSAGKAPVPRAVDMRALVAAVVDDKIALAKDRTIDIQLEPLPGASCDPGLLRLVWANLVSNAVKYTRGHDHARIRITGSVDGGEVTYAIEDNGAGFDMQHVGKLFGVFKRLHADAHFEGTGVGLSLVRRIVTRHGGRVWANGTPGAGATF